MKLKIRLQMCGMFPQTVIKKKKWRKRGEFRFLSIRSAQASRNLLLFIYYGRLAIFFFFATLYTHHYLFPAVLVSCFSFCPPPPLFLTTAIYSAGCVSSQVHLFHCVSCFVRPCTYHHEKPNEDVKEEEIELFKKKKKDVNSARLFLFLLR